MRYLIAIPFALLCGCGNMDLIDWHWTFDKAIIKIGNESQVVDVTAWHDYDDSDMIAIETRTQVFVTHSANVVLIKNKK